MLYSVRMVSSVLVAYYLWQIRALQTTTPRVPTQSRYEQTVLPTGDLTVTEESPEGMTVPPGASRVPMLKLRMTASCDAMIHVSGVHVQRKGLGATEDIEGVYLIHRGDRISQARTVNRNGSVDFSIRDLIIPKCDTEEVVVYADFSPTASAAGEHRFELSAEGVTTENATVRIDHRRGRYVLQTAGRAVGQVAVNFLQLTESIRYGTRRAVARFTLSADNRDDQNIRAITFTNDGSASDDDLRNVYVEMRDRIVSEITPSMSGDRVRITFDPPLFLKRSQTISLKLRADVRVGYSRTIGFTVEAEADVESEAATGR